MYKTNDNFYSKIRESLFSGKLTQSQVDGINFILNEFNPDADIRFVAYVLATAYHETWQTMKPIEEVGKGRKRAYGEPDPNTGKVYYGRGFVQLTWMNNYATVGHKIGVDLVGNPDAALQLDIAAKILASGMTLGLFTGKKLSDYFTSGFSNWINARRIVNGLDKAEQIAIYGKKFYTALKG